MSFNPAVKMKMKAAFFLYGFARINARFYSHVHKIRHGAHTTEKYEAVAKLSEDSFLQEAVPRPPAKSSYNMQALSRL
jgi:hypothetical protein